MSQQNSAKLTDQQLIKKHRKRHFFMQMQTLIIGVVIIVSAAQFFLMQQLAAMAFAAITFDFLRVADGTRLHWQETKTWNDAEVKALRQYFWSSTPRRWVEYALLALPANALITYAFHQSDFDTMNNAATAFMTYSDEVIGLVITETSKLQNGAATLTVDFGVVGLLEYIAMRWIFARRKLKNSK